MSEVDIARRLEALHARSPAPTNVLARIERGDGALVFSGAAGVARADHDERLTSTHRFHVASIAKTMTATLLLRQLECGAFGPQGLDAPLAAFDVLPPESMDRLWRDRGGSRSREITLRHLLTHTAGLRDAMVDDATTLDGPAPGSLIGRMMAPGADASRAWVPWDGARPHAQDAGVVNFFINSGIADAPLALPGERFHYSDTGFVLLGLLLERVTGLPLHRQMREEIFDPLGLEDTYLAYRDDPRGLGPGRWPEADCWAGQVPCLSAGVNLSFDWAGGGVVSSARSLISFLRALLGGRLFSKPATLASMLDWQVPPGLARPRTGVGLGIFRTESSCGPLVGHSGAWGGKLFYSRDCDLYFAGTTNQSASAPDWHWSLLQLAGSRPAIRGEPSHA